jgi:hypothetical protein
MTNPSPSIIHRRRPTGIPMTITANEQNAAAKVYEDATMGMTYFPVGLYDR